MSAWDSQAIANEVRIKKLNALLAEVVAEAEDLALSLEECRAWVPDERTTALKADAALIYWRARRPRSDSIAGN